MTAAVTTVIARRSMTPSASRIAVGPAQHAVQRVALELLRMAERIGNRLREAGFVVLQRHRFALRIDQLDREALRIPLDNGPFAKRVDKSRCVACIIMSNGRRLTDGQAAR